jgi:hypothetical protein
MNAACWMSLCIANTWPNPLETRGGAFAQSPTQKEPRGRGSTRQESAPLVRRVFDAKARVPAIV